MFQVVSPAIWSYTGFLCRFRNCWMTSGWSSGPRVMLSLGNVIGSDAGSLQDFSLKAEGYYLMQWTGREQNARKFWTNWKKHGNSQPRCLSRWNEAAIRINSAISCIGIRMNPMIHKFLCSDPHPSINWWFLPIPNWKLYPHRPANGFPNVDEMAELTMSVNSSWVLLDFHGFPVETFQAGVKPDVRRPKTMITFWELVPVGVGF